MGKCNICDVMLNEEWWELILFGKTLPSKARCLLLLIFMLRGEVVVSASFEAAEISCHQKWDKKKSRYSPVQLPVWWSIACIAPSEYLSFFEDLFSSKMEIHVNLVCVYTNTTTGCFSESPKNYLVINLHNHFPVLFNSMVNDFIYEKNSI